MARTPWHHHKFESRQLTPSSCLICGGVKKAPQHKKAVRRWTKKKWAKILDKDWRIWQKDV